MDANFRLKESTVFFNFARMVFIMDDPMEEVISVRILPKGNLPFDQYIFAQMFSVDENNSVILQSFIDRDSFPDAYRIEIVSKWGVHEADCSRLVEIERQEHQQSCLTDFLALLRDWRGRNPGVTPSVLDLGGRARSGYLLAEHLPGCITTVLDIRPDRGVDIVADIHDMSRTLGEDRFDFVICVSVFEHLVMPWKAAIEVNKVLKTGGAALIQTHQTVGLHDRPWDYFRFSDDSWTGLFNAATGFEIIKTLMTNFVRIIPMRYYNIEPDSEKAGGFYESSVMIRKIGPTDLVWPVARERIVETMYPH